MTGVALRARVVLEEARVLGVDLADLVAAAGAVPAGPTVAEFVASIEPTFTSGTAALLAAGDRPARRSAAR